MSAIPRRYAILGAGVAGMAAAQAIRGQDPSAEIHIVTEDPFGYYSRPGLAYAITGELGEAALYPIAKSEYRQLNLHWHTAQVVSIQPAARRLLTSGGGSLIYDRLLIATGSRAATLSAPGIQTQGVYKLDHMQDARDLLQGARKARRAVVIGGGITALELVEGLRAQGLQVHFFLRGERYWNNVLDDTESRIIEERLKEEGVQIHYRTELAEILSHQGRVSGVTTRAGQQIAGQQIACQLLAYAIGVLPRIELAQAAGIQVERGILTDEFLQTSCPDIYAAGDVAQAYDPYSGQTVLDTLWNPAREQGHIAGLNMAGNCAVFRKNIPYNVTRLAGLTTTIIGAVGRGVDPSLLGIARGDSETWRMLPNAVAAGDHQDVNRLRVMIGEQRLLGAIVMGDQHLSRPLQELIGKRADITPIRAVLLKSTPGLGDILLSFWEKWSSAQNVH